jgi:hypothetical protein
MSTLGGLGCGIELRGYITVRVVTELRGEREGKGYIPMIYVV